MLKCRHTGSGDSSDEQDRLLSSRFVVLAETRE